MNRIRANKMSLTAIDDDLEDTISSVKRRARIDLGEKLDAGTSSAGSVRATLKVSQSRFGKCEYQHFANTSNEFTSNFSYSLFPCFPHCVPIEGSDKTSRGRASHPSRQHAEMDETER